jgi:Thioredoxin
VAAVAAPAGQAWSDVLETTPDGGMRMGNPDAPIKLLEYGSLSCPHCAKLSQEGFGSLVKNYVNTGKVNFEFRSFAIHPQDVPLTVFVRCAPKEAFFPLVEQVYTNFDAMNAPYQDKAKLDQAQAAMQLPAAQRWSAFADAIGYSDFFAARGIGEDQVNVLGPDIAAVDAIGAARAAFDSADDFEFAVVVAPKSLDVAVQDHFGEIARRPRCRSGEDHIFHAPAAHRLGRAFAHHPTDRFKQVGLAAAVGPDNPGQPRLDPQFSRLDKALETRELEPLDPHRFGPFPFGLAPSARRRPSARFQGLAIHLRRSWCR